MQASWKETQLEPSDVGTNHQESRTLTAATEAVQDVNSLGPTPFLMNLRVGTAGAGGENRS